MLRKDNTSEAGGFQIEKGISPSSYTGQLGKQENELVGTNRIPVIINSMDNVEQELYHLCNCLEESCQKLGLLQKGSIVIKRAEATAEGHLACMENYLTNQLNLLAISKEMMYIINQQL